MSDQLPRSIVVAVAERAGHVCEYCHLPAHYCPESLTVDHIHPRVLAGASELSNLALACHGCNGYKHAAVEASDPMSGQVVPLFHPRCDLWEDHFAWNDDSTRIEPLTPTGRATVERLRLNRVGLVNLRSAIRHFERGS